MTAHNLIVTQDVRQDPALPAIVDKYDDLSAPIANRRSARSRRDLTTRPHERGRRTRSAT